AIAERLPNLTSLNLWNNDIGEAGARAIAERLPNLTSLDLSFNKNIQSLSAFDARVTPRGSLTALDILSCKGIQSRYRFDDNVMRQSDARLILNEARRARPEDFPPRDGLADAAAAPAVSNYRPLPLLKAMVLGQGRIGKTRLRHRLMGEAPPDYTQSTDAFDIVTLPDAFACGDLKDVRIRLFDVGGQDALHGAHRLFLGSERNLYVVMCDGSASPEDARLPYWLRMIAQFAPKAPLIVVVSHADKPRHAGWAPWSPHHPLCKDLGLSPKWIEGYVDRPAGQTIGHRVQEAEFREDVLAEIKTALADAVAASGEALSRTYDPGMIEVVDWLTASSNERLSPWFKPYGRFETYLDIKDRLMPACHAVGCENAATLMLWVQILGDLGVLCWFGSLQDSSVAGAEMVKRHVFHPDWIKGPMYRLVGGQEKQNIDVGLPSCVTTPEALESICREAELSGAEIDAMTAILRAGRLIFDVTDDADLTTHYLVVDRLRTDSKPYDVKEPGCWELVGDQHRYTFVGDAYLPRVIGRLWRPYVDDEWKDVSRNWAVFTFDATDGQADEQDGTQSTRQRERLLIKVDVNEAKVSYLVPAAQDRQRSAMLVDRVRREFETMCRRDQMEITGRPARLEEGDESSLELNKPIASAGGGGGFSDDHGDKATEFNDFPDDGASGDQNRHGLGAVLGLDQYGPLSDKPRLTPMGRWVASALSSSYLLPLIFAAIAAILIPINWFGQAAWWVITVDAAAFVFAAVLTLQAYFQYHKTYWPLVYLPASFALATGGGLLSSLGVRYRWSWGEDKFLELGYEVSVFTLILGLITAIAFAVIQLCREQRWLSTRDARSG
ncbi:MAG: leucine-rich repeat domain-containing protein, partial [Planctomycetota bacterium]